MSEHTKEPWFASGTDIHTGPQGALAYVSTAGARGRNLEEAMANARRIVACVNACAGWITTEDLEILTSRGMRLNVEMIIEEDSNA